MKRKCKRCGKSAIINFCNDCARYIQQAHENVIAHADAAVGYLLARKPAYNGHNDFAQREYRHMEMFAFLQVFHPEISADKAMALASEEPHP